MGSNFRIPYVFVVKSGNTLPATTTKSATLTVGQFGVYGPGQAAVVAGTSAAATYLQLFEGTAIPGFGNKRSDRIFKSNILELYKVNANQTAQNQITTVSGLVVHEGEELTLAFRVHSRLLDNAFSNGMLKSILVLAPCLNCGDDPCAELSAGQYDTLYQSIADKINGNVSLAPYIGAVKSGSGPTSVVTITGKPLTSPFPNRANDPFQNVFFYDKVTFNTYLGKNPEVSQDYMWVDDRCDIPGTVTTTQRSTYMSGSAAEAKRAELNYYSYMVPQFKDLQGDADYNPYYTSNADAAFYDRFYIKYFTPEQAANDQVHRLVESVEIWVPTGTGAGLQTILENNFGTFTDKSSTGTVAFTPLTP